MKKSTKYFILGFGVTAGSLVCISVFNRFIANSATNNHYLNSTDSLFYNYRLGKVHYRVSGKGSPVLLVNNTNDCYGTGYEYHKLEKLLAKKHTVYTMDLLGTGRSDKPRVCYTNFMFAQQINSFVKDVIGESVQVVSSGDSSNYVIMAALLNERLYTSLDLLNPASLEEGKHTVQFKDKIKFTLETSPIIGTFIYNLRHTRPLLERKLRTEGFYHPESIYSYDIKSLYKASHLKGSNCKYLMASMNANYVNIDVTNALSKLSLPIQIIICGDDSSCFKKLQEYKKANKNVHYEMIEEAGTMAALEIPEELCSIIC